jgi:hypothetical protein
MSERKWVRESKWWRSRESRNNKEKLPVTVLLQATARKGICLGDEMSCFSPEGRRRDVLRSV